MDKDGGEKAFFTTIITMVILLVWSLAVLAGLEKLETIKDNQIKGGVYEINSGCS